MKKLYKVVTVEIKGGEWQSEWEKLYTYDVNEAIDAAIEQKEYDELENRAERRMDARTTRKHETEIRELIVPDEFDLELFLNGETGDDETGDDEVDKMIDMICNAEFIYNTVEF